MRVFVFVSIYSVLLISATSFAADDKIVVTATRSNASSSDLPFSVNFVDGDQWHARGGAAENALASVPGLSFTGSGGPGQTRSLLIRGAKAEHTLVLVDGIPVNDPLSPSRAFDFGQLPVDDIERIEVIKGPQSVLYGSDAIGGVVHIITKSGSAATRLRLEGGSYGTLKARAALLGFHAGYERSSGFSSADQHDGNPEADGFEAWSLGGKKDFDLGPAATLKLNASFKETRTDTDRSGGRGGDSRGTFAHNSLFLFRGETLYLISSPEVEWNFAGSYSGHNRDDNTNVATGDFYKADLVKIENIFRRTFGSHALTFGTELGTEMGRSSQTTGGMRRFRGFALYLQDQASFGRFHATAGARLDTHSEHENAQTFRLGLAYWFVPDRLRLKGSAGTGFKAPSLYQTYSIYGSTALKPEKSVGGDFGLELQGESWNSGLTAFLNHYRDQIDFNTTTSKFFNQSRAESYGLEWGSELRTGHFRIANAATWLRAFDRDTRLALLRRPILSDTLTFGFRKGDFVGANLHARYVGERTDLHPSLFTRQTMPAFFTLGFDMFHHLFGGWRAIARGENLLNRHYQETSGFGVPALSAYVGLEADL